MPLKKKSSAPKSRSAAPRRKAAPSRKKVAPLETLPAVSLPPSVVDIAPAVLPDSRRLSLDVDAVHDAPALLPISGAAPQDLPIDHGESAQHIAIGHSSSSPPYIRPSPAVKKPARPAVHLSLYRKLATTFIGLAVLLLGFVLYLSFTRAAINVTRAALPMSTTFTVKVAQNPQDPQTVPGAVLETVAEGTKTVRASGEKKTVEGKACGSVTIINTQAKAQPLVATTRLLSPGNVLFRLQKDVIVPANGRLETRACADQAGKQGDIDPTRFTIPGLAVALQEKTYAVSTVKMSGGAVEVSVVTQDEVDAAMDAYAKEIAAQAAEKLKPLLSRPEVGSGMFVNEKIIRRETTAKIGEDQPEYAITLAVHVEAVFYDTDAVAKLADAQLRSALPGDKELRSVDAGKRQVTLVSDDLAAKTATLSVAVAGEAVLKETHAAFDREKLIGLSVDEVVQQLQSVEGVQKVEVKLTPAWLTRLPNLADHIDVNFQ